AFLAVVAGASWMQTTRDGLRSATTRVVPPASPSDSSMEARLSTEAVVASAAATTVATSGPPEPLPAIPVVSPAAGGVLGASGGGMDALLTETTRMDPPPRAGTTRAEAPQIGPAAIDARGDLVHDAIRTDAVRASDLRETIARTADAVAANAPK